MPAIFWRWIVSKGRRHGRDLGGDYMEVHYEELVQNPQETLAKIGHFIDHDLEYERIQQVALGSVHNPNSSFRGDGNEAEANTIGRWKRMFDTSQVRDIEASIGHLLVDTGYRLETSTQNSHSSLAVRLMNIVYPVYFDLKLWLKSDTPLARMADKRRMGKPESASAQEPKPSSV